VAEVYECTLLREGHEIRHCIIFFQFPSRLKTSSIAPDSWIPNHLHGQGFANLSKIYYALYSTPNFVFIIFRLKLNELLIPLID
jgi:hypothetical protein